jgi:tellurite resistance protein
MIEENAAYALASWKHFDDSVSGELLRAVTGAFALTAASDGDLAVNEVDRFMGLLHEQAHRFSGLDFAEVEHVFRDICGALMSDPAVGRQHALECVGSVARNVQQAELVRSAAEIALAADGRDLNSEHTALNAICEALGLRPR